MKEIEIIINGDKLERVKRILSAFSKNGIFVSQGFGYGHQQGYHQVYTRDDQSWREHAPQGFGSHRGG